MKVKFLKNSILHCGEYGFMNISFVLDVFTFLLFLKDAHNRAAIVNVFQVCVTNMETKRWNEAGKVL